MDSKMIALNIARNIRSVQIIAAYNIANNSFRLAQLNANYTGPIRKLEQWKSDNKVLINNIFPTNIGSIESFIPSDIICDELVDDVKKYLALL
jgi:hypothetical protein